MDPVRNPYSPGAGSLPPELAGRDRELEAFDIAVQRLTLGRSAKSQLLTGPRGVGKTVLLREFGRLAAGLAAPNRRGDDDLAATMLPPECAHYDRPRRERSARAAITAVALAHARGETGDDRVDAARRAALYR